MASHDDRMGGIGDAFAQANQLLIGRLQALDDGAATRSSGGAWTPAQIGLHVALTNEFLSAVLSGQVEQMNVPRPRRVH